MRKSRTLLVTLISIPVVIFGTRQIIMEIQNSRALKTLRVIESYSQDYYSKNGTYESFCADEKVNALIQPFISKPRRAGNEELDRQYKLIEGQTGGRAWCFGDKERYEVSIRFKLNNILDRYCEVRNIDEKPFCSHDTP